MLNNKSTFTWQLCRHLSLIIISAHLVDRSSPWLVFTVISHCLSFTHSHPQRLYSLSCSKRSVVEEHPSLQSSQCINIDWLLTGSGGCLFGEPFSWLSSKESNGCRLYDDDMSLSKREKEKEREGKWGCYALGEECPFKFRSQQLKLCKPPKGALMRDSLERALRSPSTNSHWQIKGLFNLCNKTNKQWSPSDD